jgi:hypothetical protein
MPDDQLTLRERVTMLVLMAEARELTNAELTELAGCTLDGAPRRRVNDLGLVSSTKVGRAYVHELTERGTLWCREEFTRARPARSGSAGGALYRVMAGIRRFMDRTGNTVADIYQPDVTSQIVQAYDDLTDRRGQTIRLAVLREHLDTVPRDEFDRALLALASREDVHVWAEPDQKTLTERDRAAAMVLGDTARHLLMIETRR